MKIGIMSAMQEEIESLLSVIESPKIYEAGMRKYYIGKLWDVDAVLVFSRWGKVASSSTATNLIVGHKVDKILFSGVAGAIDNSLNIGDVVIGNNLYQHDMDARPLFEQFAIPLTGKISFQTNETMNGNLLMAANTFFKEKKLNKETKYKFNIDTPKVIRGDIASGDKFISDIKDSKAIKNLLPNIVCVEMEGGAVAQVCHEYNVPFSIIRTISDAADENSVIDFPEFIKNIASVYTYEIVQNYFNLII